MKRLRTILAAGVLAAACLMPAALSVSAQGFTSEDTGLESTAQQAGFSTTLPCRDDVGGCIPFILGNVVKALLGIFGALFLALIVYGGVLYMVSRGEKEMIAKAKQTIVNAILGMVIVAASYAIANFVLEAISGAVGASG